MADPERTSPVTEAERAEAGGTLPPGQEQTLMPPAEPVTEPGVGAEGSQTLALPPSLAQGAQPLARDEVPATLVPQTVAPPRLERPGDGGEAIAPPAPRGDTTERAAASAAPALAESSGTLLDADLPPADRLTRSVAPAAFRPTAPVAIPDPVNAPSTVARPLAPKTGRMGAAVLPAVPGYEILGELGRGGMGVVYKARQKGLNRTVALKMVLSAGRATAEELARFQTEAEAVALLHHPNIVQVYDVGVLQGLPYFSLEFCPGGTLADRAGGKPLPPRLAARLVRDVARGVHHAHQRLILHRDLKPANVLLAPADAAPPGRGARGVERKDHKTAPLGPSVADDDQKTEVAPRAPAATHRPGGAAGRLGDLDLERCVPKVTDFGLAKRLEGDTGQTRDGSVMGTPSYMAPEQAQGKVRELGPPADVYALGAILYDLLTGRPPFHGDTVMDTLHQVIHGEPLAPQRVHAPVPRDLDTICLKCLEKDPAQRYASADALAEDLRRFLDGEPILARPAPWWERAVKWARRRPAAATLAVVCALAAAGLGVGGYVLARQEAVRAETESRLRDVAEREKSEADAQRERAQQLQALAEDHFRKACAAVDALLARIGHERLAHEPHLEQVRRELLHKAAMFYEGFLRERGDDPSLKWQTARTQKNLGDIQEMLGDQRAAEERYRTALALFDGLRAAAPDDRRYVRDQAATQHNLGLLLSEAGRFTEAERSLGAARDLRRGLVEAHAGNEARRELAASDHALGLLLERRGDLAAAEADFNAALAQQKVVAEAAGEQDEAAVKAWQDVARTENSLGRVAEAAGRRDDADRNFQGALAILTRLADRVNVPEVRQELGQTYDNLGRLHRDTDPAKAAKDFAEAVKVAEKLVQDFPATPAYRQDLAAALDNLGVLLLAAGKGDEAEGSFGRALGIKERLAAEVHWVPDYRRDYGASLNNRGIQLKTQARAADAEKTFSRAAKVLGDLAEEHADVPDYQRELARTLVNRALVRQSAGKPAEAEPLLRKALALQEKLSARRDAPPESRGEKARTRVALGVLYQTRGQSAGADKGREDFARAEAEYRAALSQYKELAEQNPKEPDFRYQQALAASALATLLADRGQTAEAREAWDQAAGLLGALAEQHPGVPGYALDLGRTLNNRARNHALAKEQKNAAELWKRAAAVLGDLVRCYPKEAAPRQELALTERNLANLALLGNRLDEATAAFRRAVAALEGLPAEPPPAPAFRHDVMLRHRELADQLAITGPPRDAEAERRRVVELCRGLVKDVPNEPVYASDLGAAADALAMLLLVQNRPADSRPLLEEAVAAQRSALNATGAAVCRQLLLDHLSHLMDVLFQLGDHAAAASATGELLAVVPPDWPGRPAAAAALSHCAALAAADTKLPETKRTEVSQSYADRAMAELRRAAKGGFKDASYLKTTKDFDPLRQRDDFRDLVRQMGG